MKKLLLTGLLGTLLTSAAWAQSATVSLLAGGVPYADGPAGAGRYQQASALYLDAAGNLLFTDQYQVRQVSPTGVLSTVAGLPRSGGTATSPAGTLGEVQGLTGDAAGNLYLGNTSSIRRLSPGGQVTPVPNASLGNLASFVRTSGGDFYTLEGMNYWVLRKVTASGVASVQAGILGKPAYRDGGPGVGKLGTVGDMVLNTDGNFYFADGPLIRRFNPSTGTLLTIAGDSTTTAFADGQGRQAHFGYYCRLALAPGGNLYVSDGLHACLRLVTPAGVVTTLAGSPDTFAYADGTGSAARFDGPGPLATLPNGDVLLAEYPANRIRRITPAGVVTTYLPASGTVAFVDGTGSAARFISPGHLSVGAGGNLLLLDGAAYGDDNSNYLAGGRIRQVTPTGAVTTLFTLNQRTGYLDGPIATAQFGFEMFGAAQDAAGNVYLTDLSNACIRKITPAGVVSTLAGNPTRKGNYQDGTGTQASFSAPYGLTIDGAGNLYVADLGFLNIRKITPAGVVTTVAGYMGNGTPPYSLPPLDGQGSAARLGIAWGLTALPDGTLYFADHNLLRRVSPTGVVTTIAGDYPNGVPGQVDGVGRAARLNFQYGVMLAVTPGGVVFASEQNIDFNPVREARTRIRRIAPDGTVTTVVASNESGYVDGPGATAVLGSIRGLAYTAAGTLVFSDLPNHCLRQVGGAALLGTRPANLAAGSLRAYPNPASGGTFAAELPAGAGGQPATLSLHDALGRLVWQQTYAAAPAAVEAVPTATLPAGFYYLHYAGPAGASTCPVQVQ